MLRLGVELPGAAAGRGIDGSANDDRGGTDHGIDGSANGDRGNTGCGGAGGCGGTGWRNAGCRTDNGAGARCPTGVA